VMANAADKAVTRGIVAAHGVAVPAGELVRSARQVSLPAPVVVKPAGSDNSAGVTLVDDLGTLEEAVAAASAFGGDVLVETYVPLGREVRCGVVELDGELVGLPLEEYALDAAQAPIRLAADKLRRSQDGELRLVAKETGRTWIVAADDPVVESVWQAARAAYRALGARQYCLFDFRIDPQGKPWFLEAGPYCSFAPSSVLAKMAAAAGLDVPALFDAVYRGKAVTA
jgi:D-alanine-D-alanine ligase